MFKKLSAWFQLIPMVIALMRAMEEAIPGRGRGEARLAALREALEFGWDELNGILGDFPNVWERIVGFVKRTVARFNDDPSDDLFVKGE